MMIHKCEFSPPPPPLECTRGPHAYSHHSREKRYFPREKPKKGVFLNQSPEIWGVFQKLPEKSRRRGYNLCVHVSFNSLQRQGNRALFSLLISDRAPRGYSGKIRTHISRARGKENKIKERE